MWPPLAGRHSKPTLRFGAAGGAAAPVFAAFYRNAIKGKFPQHRCRKAWLWLLVVPYREH